ncbi:MAG: hypothetical protein AAFY99_11630 [Pseudomonadota bacterium]
MTDKEVVALATMIAAPVTSGEISWIANALIMTAAFCVMSTMAFILSRSLKRDLEIAGRSRP